MDGHATARCSFDLLYINFFFEMKIESSRSIICVLVGCCVCILLLLRVAVRVCIV